MSQARKAFLPLLLLARCYFLRLMRWMPKAIDKAHLEWARSELSKHNPMHPDLPYIVTRLREMEEA